MYETLIDKSVEIKDLAGKLLHSLPKLRDLTAQPPTWMWPSLVADSAFHVMAGEPGSMKSMFFLQFAIGAAQGDLFGQKTEPRPVIYVDRENPLAMIKERAGKLGLVNEDNLFYWGLWNNDPPPNIDHYVYPILAEGLKPLIIFDSLIRFHSGDENDAGHIATVTKHFRELCAKGATIIVLHHKGKPKFEGPSSPYRGSSEISGACDIGYSIAKKDSGDFTEVVFTAFKNRFEAEQEFKFVFDHATEAFVATTEPVLDKWELMVKEAITKVPGMRAVQISMVTKISEAKVRAILKRHTGTLWVEVKDGNSFAYFPNVESKGLTGSAHVETQKSND